MDLIDILLIIVMAYLILSNLWDFLTFAYELSKHNSQCPPHIWEYNSSNKLQCKRPGCSYVAGSDHIPRGDDNAK